MADTLRIKRRAVGGAAGAPSSLAAAELAYNEVDDTLYYGRGNSGGLAITIIPIAGPGSFLLKTVKLDELAAPTDITTLNASTTAHGLLRKLDNVATHYLDGTGTWTAPPSGTGPAGPAGANASAVSTSAFTVPAVGATATVTLADASWVVVGQMLYAASAGGGPGLAGALQVTAKAGNVVTLLNPPSAAPTSSLSVFIETPSNKIYVLDLDVPQAYTVTKFSVKTVSGTCTASLNQNGTAITGAGSVSST
jgi:hypothetical protein